MLQELQLCPEVCDAHALHVRVSVVPVLCTGLLCRGFSCHTTDPLWAPRGSPVGLFELLLQLFNPALSAETSACCLP